MTDRPAGLRPGNADVFKLDSVARVYHHRPPYPAGVVDALRSLQGGGGGAVLDAGCGTGELARALAAGAERVDAVDVSQAMIDEGRRQEGGDHANLRWVCARLEDADLRPPYALAVAGDSLEWMDREVVLPRLHDAMRPGAWLAIVHRNWGTGAPEETELLRTYSTIRDFEPHDLGRELVSRGLLDARGYLRFAGAWRPTIEEYVQSRHSQAGFARERMGADRTAEFDHELTTLLRRLVTEGRLRTTGGGARLDLQVVAEVGWGRPLRRQGGPGRGAERGCRAAG
jgi:SAM-dependent methyltransferase